MDESQKPTSDPKLPDPSVLTPLSAKTGIPEEKALNSGSEKAVRVRGETASMRSGEVRHRPT